MKTTIFGVVLDVTPEPDMILRRLMRKYGFMLRFAYNRLLHGLSNRGDLERHLSSETELPLRYAKDAVQDAQELVRARHVAMQNSLELWTKRLQKTQERLALLRVAPRPNLRRIEGLERKLAKQQAQQARYQQYVGTRTFPPVVFGGRQLWRAQFRTLDDPVAEQQRRQQWREAWDEARNGRLSARGDKTKKGNLQLRVSGGLGAWFLEVATDVRVPRQSKKHQNQHKTTSYPEPVFPSRYYQRLTIPLYVARKVSQKTGIRNGRDYEDLLSRVLAAGIPYQVEILRRRGRYQVRITVEEIPAPITTTTQHGWVGIDTNSTFLALCHVLPDGNPTAFHTLGDPRLYDARSGQRAAIVGSLAREAVQWAKARRAGIVVEDLRFVHDRDVNAKFNRVTHQFNYRALLTAVEREALRQGVAFRPTHPAYTSFIGRIKYQPQWGVNVHHVAALVIARRGGLKIRREHVPKAVRRWMQAQQRWNDAAYRRQDWSTWAQVKREITKALNAQHHTLDQWIMCHRQLLNITM